MVCNVKKILIKINKKGKRREKKEKKKEKRRKSAHFTISGCVSGIPNRWFALRGLRGTFGAGAAASVAAWADEASADNALCCPTLHQPTSRRVTTAGDTDTAADADAAAACGTIAARRNTAQAAALRDTPAGTEGREKK